MLDVFFFLAEIWTGLNILTVHGQEKIQHIFPIQPQIVIFTLWCLCGQNKQDATCQEVM